MRLYLVRHAQTAWNREGRAQGHSDIPLDEHGQTQARLLAERFEGHTLATVWSSDLSRCVATAEGIVRRTGAPLTTCQDLRERGFGEWEGRDFTEITGELYAPGRDPFTFRPPGGESMHDVWERIGGVSERLAAHTEDLAVVTHGGVCALLLARLLRGGTDTARAFRFSNTGVTVLGRRPDGMFRLDQYDNTDHLNAAVLSGDLDGAHR